METATDLTYRDNGPGQLERKAHIWDFDRLSSYLQQDKAMLTSIRTISFGNLDEQMDIPAMAQLVSLCPNIRELWLDYTLLGTPTDLVCKALGEALAGLNHLRGIHIRWSNRKPNLSLHVVNFLSPFLLRLCPPVPCEIFISFGHPIELAQQVMVDFFAVCQNSTRLKRLGVTMRTCSQCQGEALGQLIRHSSSLEEIRFTVDVYDEDVSMLGEGCLKLNFLAGDLKHSSSLKDLKLFWRHYPGAKAMSVQDVEEEVTSFLLLLQAHNFSLKTLVILPWLRQLKFQCPWRCLDSRLSHLPNEVQAKIAEISFLLFLNQKERGKLMGPLAHPTTNDWIEAMAHQTDPSVAYYYLKANPSLCDANGMGKKDGKNTPQEKQHGNDYNSHGPKKRKQIGM